jgi:hypothetical protein
MRLKDYDACLVSLNKITNYICWNIVYSPPKMTCNIKRGIGYLMNKMRILKFNPKWKKKLFNARKLKIIRMMKRTILLNNQFVILKLLFYVSFCISDQTKVWNPLIKCEDNFFNGVLK